jgi:drug/metabolite transporter (DMT)-like permease
MPSKASSSGTSIPVPQQGYTRRRAYLELHLAVLLFGFTAILGRLIHLEETPLVFFRMGLTALSLLFFPGVYRRVRSMPAHQRWQLAGIGTIVALHWVTFFGSIKASTVSITLSCFGTTALFSSVIEPLVTKRRFRAEELLIGVLILPGIWLIHRATVGYGLGILLGLISAALAATFSSLNKNMVEHHDAQSLTFVELASGFVFLGLLMPFRSAYGESGPFWPAPMDWLWLLVLALLCTTLAYVLSIRALRPLSAFASNLTINLEPIYGILLAMLVFQEHQVLPPTFYLGAGIVLAAVFVHPILSRRLNRGVERA